MSRGDFILWAMRLYTSGLSDPSQQRKRLLNESREPFAVRRDSPSVRNRDFATTLGYFTEAFNMRYRIPAEKAKNLKAGDPHLFFSEDLEYRDFLDEKGQKDTVKMKEMIDSYGIEGRKGEELGEKSFLDYWEGARSGGNCSGFTLIALRLFNGFGLLTDYIQSPLGKTLYGLKESDSLPKSLPVQGGGALSQRLRLGDQIGFWWLRQSAESPRHDNLSSEGSFTKPSKIIELYESYLRSNPEAIAKDGRLSYLPYHLTLSGSSATLGPLEGSMPSFEGLAQIQLSGIPATKKGTVTQLKNVQGKITFLGQSKKGSHDDVEIAFEGGQTLNVSLPLPQGYKEGQLNLGGEAEAALVIRGPVESSQTLSLAHKRVHGSQFSLEGSLGEGLEVNGETTGVLGIQPTTGLSLSLKMLGRGELAKFTASWAHSLLPYSFQKTGPHTYRLGVYDSNRPGDETEYIEIDTQTESWENWRTEGGQRKAVWEKGQFAVAKALDLADSEFASHAVYNLPLEMIEFSSH